MTFEAILYIGVLILSAKLFGELLHRIKQPTILGNVIAGIIVGPALFALVEPIDEIELFISIGVFFLFFLIGLEEIDVPGLFRVLRKRIFAGAAVAFLVPFSAASALGIATDMEFVNAFAIASVIGASSLGVTAKILTDLGKLRSTLGLEIFTMTAIVEFIAIIFVSVMIQINSAGDVTEITDIAWLFIKMIIFFGVAGAFSVFVLPRIMRGIKKHLKAKEIYFAAVVGFILLVAYFAEISGIHGAIGALLLGVAVSRMPREEYFEISKSLHAVGYGIFIPIFFAGIGLHFLPNFWNLPLWIIVGFLAVIVGVKFFGSYIAAKFARMRPTNAVAYGVMSKGAVDLALMLSLLSSNLLEEDLFSLLVFGTLMMMVLSSVLLQKSLKKIVQIKIGSSEIGMMPLYFRKAVSNLKVEDVMSEKFTRVPHTLTVSEYLQEYPDADKTSYLVFDDAENLLGAVSPKEIKKVTKDMRSMVQIGKIVYPNIAHVTLDEYLFSAVQKLNSQHFHLMPVLSLDYQHVVGIVNDQMIMDLLVQEEQK
ncbi:cation:proton antiporter [Nitrosopumilus sp. K4]|uniref:cation:proton antiporter domain-containing protein n=1 Tax=Nitrosopumilus sp. K4 TaxID=2795383 RepID=UPI001BA7D6A9|nr:cation:proton antiporter [Nitrosopumilus sp. K4]QUC63906.1 cation:proton antiporter [Nitrosopumilus sp. K4]